MLTAKRVDFVTLADYSEKSEMEQIVYNIIEKIVATEKLVALHNKHKKSASSKK